MNLCRRIKVRRALIKKSNKSSNINKKEVAEVQETNGR
ncbi:unnamed protein product [Oikopleura dioica]|uniref:Uncharacterized protein n=1 Tax=Oikopleura dioica TaxID=34765 RepID=E4Y8W8_OIKDI|nr:unnamed protein product [Oikopleura dioica]